LTLRISVLCFIGGVLVIAHHLLSADANWPGFHYKWWSRSSNFTVCVVSCLRLLFVSL